MVGVELVTLTTEIQDALGIVDVDTHRSDPLDPVGEAIDQSSFE